LSASISLRHLILALPFVLLVLFLVYPVAVVLLQGLLSGPGSSFSEVVQSVVTQRIFIFTVSEATLSTALALVIGVPGAIILAKLRFKGKILAKALLTVPFIMPPIVVVVGFLEVFGSGGIVDGFLMWLLHSQTSVFNLAYGYTGIVLAHAFYNIPLFLLLVSASLERLDPELEEVAEILGATPSSKFTKLVVPHIKSSVLAASILTFLFCFMSFPIVLALGQGNYATLEVQIWNAFRFFDYGEAASLALIQLIITLALAYAYVRAGQAERKHAGRTAYSKTIQFSSLTRKRQVMIGIYAIVLGILVVGPMVAILRASVYDPNSGGLTLRGFANLFNASAGGDYLALVNSLFYAGLATVFSVAIGLLLAYAQHSRGRVVPQATSMLSLLPLGVSAITIAYGLMIAIAVPLGMSSNPWPLIIIAQTLIGVPFSYRAIELAQSKIDPSLIELADSLGASRFHRLFFVEIPLLLPGILVAAIFSFSMAIGEMSATIFLATPENITLTILIYRDLAIRKFVEAGAASLLLVTICIAAFVILEKVSENGYGGTV
jgi:thiamine transport system permease protein